MLTPKDISTLFEVQVNTLYNWRKTKPKLYGYLQNADYNSKINISNFTKEKLKEEYTFRFLDLVTVKGKSEPIEVWQVIQKEQANKTLKSSRDLFKLIREITESQENINENDSG